MHISIITCLPRLIESPFNDSILKRAQAKGLASVEIIDLREYATGKHKPVDDYTFGGGAGMVMKAVPLSASVEEPYFVMWPLQRRG